jgi:outer membrane lipoprotein-sorting protein
MWQGKPVFVVGAKLGDTTTKQFWVEKDRLLFVRLLEPNPKRGLIDVRFDKYERAGKAWIAMRVEQYVAGKRTLLEEYSNVRTDVKLAADLFDPKQWTTVAHWALK